MDDYISHSGVCRFRRTDGSEIRFSHATGPFVFDTRSHRFVDFVLGFGPVIIGHAKPEFNERLAHYLQYGIHLPGYTKWHGLFLERLLGSQLGHLASCFFKTGSESVSAAIRLGTMISGKKGVLRCGYIGWHDVLIGNSIRWHEAPGCALRNEIRMLEGLRGISASEPVYNWGTLELDELSSIIRDANQHVGTFVFDAYQLAFSTIDTLRAAISMCREERMSIVIDETKTAGRVSSLSIAIDNELDFDFLVMGKALANGAPLSLLVGDQRLIELAEAARIGGTFSKELIAVYCGLATLDILRSTDGLDQIQRAGNRFVDVFNMVAKEIGITRSVKASSVFGGAIFDIRFGPDVARQKGIRELLPKSLAENGILLLEGHPSFVSLDHWTLDWSDLSTKLTKGLHKWACALP